MTRFFVPYQAAGQSANESFAGLVGNHFFVMPTMNRFSFLPGAGLMLTNAQTQDSGDYSVEVDSHDGRGLVETHERRITLVVGGQITAWVLFCRMTV